MITDVNSLLGGLIFSMTTSGHPLGFVQSSLSSGCGFFFSKSHGKQLPGKQRSIIRLHTAARAELFNPVPIYNNK